MVILAASSGNAVGMAVGGILAVLLISAVFYFVGRGEDRDRAAPSGPPSEADPVQPESSPAPPSAAAQHARRPPSSRRRRRP